MKHQQEALLPPALPEHIRDPFLCLPIATLSKKFHQFVRLNSLRRRGSKRQDLSPHISSFPQHPKTSLVPTTYGKSHRQSKLPGHCLGMQLKTNIQPMASAATSKSELSFVLYLHSRMCLRQRGNTLPGSVRRYWD